MMTEKLRKIFDDENMTITLESFCQIVHEMNQIAWEAYFNEYDKNHSSNCKLAFIAGEIDAFNILLYLLDYLE